MTVLMSHHPVPPFSFGGKLCPCTFIREPSALSRAQFLLRVVEFECFGVLSVCSVLWGSRWVNCCWKLCDVEVCLCVFVFLGVCY